MELWFVSVLLVLGIVILFIGFMLILGWLTDTYPRACVATIILGILAILVWLVHEKLSGSF